MKGKRRRGEERRGEERRRKEKERENREWGWKGTVQYISIVVGGMGGGELSSSRSEGWLTAARREHSSFMWIRT